ncbi:hypothetical protein MGMO_92c00490 [Methyloglobulus morosus KoM1]|uniref:Uncharacterized protein n=1 Tax=Methyloglobulus morosus KoM1 TaxID=1116472 RepID=V5BZS9_9GAMM|nr:hypothetical protein MGMO_92c00490 [Methyloglobulus morosus KoM1]
MMILQSYIKEILDQLILFMVRQDRIFLNQASH